MDKTKKRESRIRVNLKMTSKGFVMPEITVEMSNTPRTDVLIEATKTFDEALAIANKRTEENRK